MFLLPARVTCRTESSALFIIIRACSNGACLVYAWAYDSISIELLKYFTLFTFKNLYFANFGNAGIQKSSSHLRNSMRLKILKKHEKIRIHSCIPKIRQILKFGKSRFFGGKGAVFDHLLCFKMSMCYTNKRLVKKIKNKASFCKKKLEMKKNHY